VQNHIPVPAKSGAPSGEKSRSNASVLKPKKPYPEFPLFPHQTRRWAKKIRGRFAFFGPWSDPQGALERFLAQRDELMAGLVPRARRALGTGGSLAHGGDGANRRGRSRGRGTPTTNANGANVGGTHEERVSRTSPGVVPDGFTIRDLVNHFLTVKQRKMEAGEMSRRSFSDYHLIAKRFLTFFGPHRLAADLLPEDFGRMRADLAKTRGALALGADITKIKGFFKFGYESGLIDRPMRFGQHFEKPTRKAVRKARSNRASQMFEPPEIKKLLAQASPQVKAMILLGLNCGMGNTDLSSLPRSALNLKKRMLVFPRPKTGVERRAPLWRETVAALETVAEVRPDAKRREDGGLVFITKYGAPWVRVQEPKGTNKSGRTAVVIDGIGLEFGKLMQATKTRVPGRGFYALRHTFRTVADEIGDRRAFVLIMGHENGNDISTH
jgi:integrase